MCMKCSKAGSHPMWRPYWSRDSSCTTGARPGPLRRTAPLHPASLRAAEQAGLWQHAALLPCRMLQYEMQTLYPATKQGADGRHCQRVTPAGAHTVLQRYVQGPDIKKTASAPSHSPRLSHSCAPRFAMPSLCRMELHLGLLHCTLEVLLTSSCPGAQVGALRKNTQHAQSPT